jgi:hypothetical protein
VEAVDAENSEVKKLRELLADQVQKVTRLSALYRDACERILLLERQIFRAKAERVNVDQLNLQFAAQKAELDKLAGQLDEASIDIDASKESTDTDASLASESEDAPNEALKKRGGRGRRNLDESALPIEVVELRSPEFDERNPIIGWETSWRLGYRRGGMIRIKVSRAIYRTAAEEKTSDVASDASEHDGNTAPKSTIHTTELGREVQARSLLAPSLMAHLLMTKFGHGVPFYRQEEMCKNLGAAVDRGTMSRMAENVGATLLPVVDAMLEDAIQTAFCIATDATGVAVQATADERNQSGRAACRRAHFFVAVADRTHVLFRYEPKHTSAAVQRLFHGFTGYIQADAHTVYDALFSEEDSAAFPTEVGCWSHARRYFWNAASAGDIDGKEALFRIRMWFENERLWKELPPRERASRRIQRSKPLVDDFFRWVESRYEARGDERGLFRSALVYVRNQEIALRRFLTEGRLLLDNNRSERALRTVAVGRKNWLFVGSDDHGNATACIFSLLASARLHGLDPELYLADLIRVFPAWPRSRYLELAPKNWAATRARLSKKQLEEPVGVLTVPPAL